MTKQVDKIYLKFITRNTNKHVKCDEVISAFIHNFKTKISTYINFSHPDLPIDDTFSNFIKKLTESDIKIYVIDKKRYRYWIDANLIDLNLFGFIHHNEIYTPKSNGCNDYLKSQYIDINDYNLIVPYAIHQSLFDNEVKDIKKYIDDDNSYCFKFFNNIITDTLYEVEKNGIKVDESVFRKYFDAKICDGFVYTHYNIYNPTGRPSNSYDGINYVALKKDDGSRSSFVSRYANGKLLMVDFTGFHPYIVANLIGYNVPEQETIYEHLAKLYYNIQTVTSDIVSRSKKLTMINLYGQINEQYLNLEFFKKTNDLKDRYWKEFNENGYVTTPIYKRKITQKHVVGANKNKLFAYIIQAVETEYGIDRLRECIKYCKGKEILPILYNYDAILFDVGNVDNDVIDDLVNLIKNNRFKVKIYKGNNYNDLVQI